MERAGGEGRELLGGVARNQPAVQCKDPRIDRVQNEVLARPQDAITACSKPIDEKLERAISNIPNAYPVVDKSFGLNHDIFGELVYLHFVVAEVINLRQSRDRTAQFIESPRAGVCLNPLLEFGGRSKLLACDSKITELMV